MEIRQMIRAPAAFALALAFGVLATACDNPVDVDHGHHHAEPEGVIVRLGDEVIATAEGTDGDDETRLSTGSIDVLAGGETGLLEVIFVDHDGDPVEIDDHTSLGFSVADEAVATFELDPSDGFAGRVVGHQAGSTTITFRLMHGSHADFTAEPIVIHVVD